LVNVFVYAIFEKENLDIQEPYCNLNTYILNKLQNGHNFTN